jgi:O-antigen ligase
MFFLLLIITLINLPPLFIFYKFLTLSRVGLLIIFGCFALLTFKKLILAKKNKVSKDIQSRYLFLFLLILLVQSISLIGAVNIKEFISRYEISIFMLLFSYVFFNSLNNQKLFKFIDLFILTFIPNVIFEMLLFSAPYFVQTIFFPFMHPKAVELINFNLYRNRNYVESFSFVVIPILVYKTFFTKRALVKVLSILFLIIIFLLAIVSNFRIYLLLFIISFLMSIFTISNKRILKKKLIYLFILLSIIFFSYSGSIKGGIVDRILLTEGADYQTVVGRFVLWKRAFEVGIKHPLTGIGVGQFQNYTRNNYKFQLSPNSKLVSGSSQVFDDPHNIFFSFFVETGAVGLLAITWILANFIRDDVSTFNLKSKNEKAFYLNRMLIISFWSLIIYSLINPVNINKFYLFFVIIRVLVAKQFKKDLKS